MLKLRRGGAGKDFRTLYSDSLACHRVVARFYALRAFILSAHSLNTQSAHQSASWGHSAPDTSILLHFLYLLQVKPWNKGYMFCQGPKRRHPIPLHTILRRQKRNVIQMKLIIAENHHPGKGDSVTFQSKLLSYILHNCYFTIVKYHNLTLKVSATMYITITKNHFDNHSSNFGYC